MTFGVQSVVFCFIYCLHKLKMLVYKKWSSSYPDARASDSQTGLIQHEKVPFDQRAEFAEHFEFQ
jgi:hypothetical protein